MDDFYVDISKYIENRDNYINTYEKNYYDNSDVYYNNIINNGKEIDNCEQFYANYNFKEDYE